MMNSNYKSYIETNYDYLIRVYNRFVRKAYRSLSDDEYYALPFMNQIGYPSIDLNNFFIYYYNKKFNTKILYKEVDKNVLISIYMYIKLIILYCTASIFFKKLDVNQNYNVVHGFHDRASFSHTPYKTSKTPPFEHFTNGNILFHDINLSFIDFKDLIKYRQHNITFSLRYLSFLSFIKLHFKALKIYIYSKKLYSFNFFEFSYTDILYTLVKGYSIASMINNLNKKSIYFNMWENRGYHRIIDLLINDPKKNIFLDLAIIFRLSPQYSMFYYGRHVLKSQFFFMSSFNYNLIKSRLVGNNYSLFKNYRIDCTDYSITKKNTNILLIAPLSDAVSKRLYEIMLDYNYEIDMKIKLKLHPYLNSDKYNSKYLEFRDIYSLLDDYEIIVYAGITTAAIELFFQNKKVYKYVTEEFIDIDPLVDDGLIQKITSLTDININEVHSKKKYNLKDYYLGCNNKSLSKLLKERK